MTKSDKKVIYAEVFGTKVGLPQYYDDNDDPVVISTQSPMPVQIIGGMGGTDGKSAYEIAVDNGFTGDEAAWLLALKGAKGEPGTNGTNGDKGAAFTYADFTQPQLDALKGPKGDAGTPGTPGKDADPQFTPEQVTALLALLEE